MELTPISFENKIKECLDERAKIDAQFAISYAKKNKSIKECCNFILQEVSKANKDKSKCLGFPADEIIGLAVHYYDEDDIKVKSSPSNVKVATASAPKEAKKTEVKAANNKKPRKKKEETPKVEVEDVIPQGLVIPIF